MKCLCCNKELKENEVYWHKKCIKSFFGTSNIPNIDNIKEDLSNKAYELLSNKKNITGVQTKLSLGLSKQKDKLTVFDYPLGYIIKPETNEFNDIARVEYLTMLMAKECKINTVPFGLIKQNDNYVYITKRIDRNDDGKMHMEDFCQLSNLPTERKYSGSYERLGKLIKQYSSFGLKDLTDFYYLVLFNFISCNSDMHLKNFSLIEGIINYLSPAYDLLPVNIIYPKDKEEVALTLNGKKRNLTKKDFIEFGLTIGLNNKVIDYLIKNIISYEDNLINLIDKSLISDDHKINYQQELIRRINILK